MLFFSSACPMPRIRWSIQSHGLKTKRGTILILQFSLLQDEAPGGFPQLQSWVSVTFNSYMGIKTVRPQCVVFLIMAIVSSIVSSRVSLNLSNDMLFIFFWKQGLVMQGGFFKDL